MISPTWQYVGVVISGGYMDISGFGEVRLKYKKDGFHKLVAYVKKDADPTQVLVVLEAQRDPMNFCELLPFLVSKGRRALCQAAKFAIRQGPVCQEMYQQLVRRGKLRRIALVAVARHIVCRLNSLLKSHYAPAPPSHA